MSASQILARVECLMMDKASCDSSIFFSEESGTFWVRTVIKVQGKFQHIDGEGKRLLEAFEKMIAKT